MADNFDKETKKLIKTLKNLENINFKSINKNIGQSLRNSTLDRFKAQQDLQGNKWTKKQYGNKRKKLLNDTGALRKSIKYKADEKSVLVGTNLVYAKTHQFGAKNRKIKAKRKSYLRFKVDNSWISKKEVKVNIPARPFLGISDDDKTDIKDILLDYMEGTIK